VPDRIAAPALSTHDDLAFARLTKEHRVVHALDIPTPLDWHRLPVLYVMHGENEDADAADRRHEAESHRQVRNKSAWRGDRADKEQSTADRYFVMKSFGQKQALANVPRGFGNDLTHPSCTQGPGAGYVAGPVCLYLYVTGPTCFFASASKPEITSNNSSSMPLWRMR